MLTLKFDTRCGFNNIYVTEQNVQFPLPLVMNEALSMRLFKQSTMLTGASEEDV